MLGAIILRFVARLRNFLYLSCFIDKKRQNYLTVNIQHTNKRVIIWRRRIVAIAKAPPVCEY